MKYPPRSSSTLIAGEVARPVFGIDIDGTIGQYHEHFTRFASAYLGKDLPAAWDYEGGPFHRHLGLSKTTYRQVKMAYRRGGLKRSMPVYVGAEWLARSIRRRGALVVICTTRPFLQLDNVEPDTLHWLRRNRIQHDGVITGEYKYRDLCRQYGMEQVVSVLEDLPALATQAAAVGLTCNLMKRIYNLGFQPNGTYCPTIKFATEVLHDQLDEWETKWLGKISRTL